MIKQVWKTVFSKPKYIIILVISAIIFYLLNVIIQNYTTIVSFSKTYGIGFTLEYLFNASIKFYEATHLHSYITLIILSLMVGMLISLITFKVNNSSIKSKSGLAGIGLFIALFAPGCAACGIGLIAALGLSGVILTFLPFEGLEISILAILILGFAIFKTSKDLTVCKACNNIQQLKGGKTYGRK